MNKYTLHVDFEAPSDQAAISVASHLVEDVLQHRVDQKTWDVSGVDPTVNEPDWSVIIDRSSLTVVRHNRGHQVLKENAPYLPGDHGSDECDTVRTVESDLLEDR